MYIYIFFYFLGATNTGTPFFVSNPLPFWFDAVKFGIFQRNECDFWKERIEKPLNASRNLENFQNFDDLFRSYKGEKFQILAW